MGLRAEEICKWGDAEGLAGQRRACEKRASAGQWGRVRAPQEAGGP